MLRPALLSTALALAACSAPPQGRTPYAPSPTMTEVLSEYQHLRPHPVSSLPVADVRAQPTLIDADRAIPNVAGLPAVTDPVPQVTSIAVSGASGPLAARLFRPALAKNTPMVLFFHGGGFVSGDLDSTDASARALALRTGDVVLSVQVRQAPEDPFPAAHDDALAAYHWTIEHARELGGDPTRLALAGESAGGSLALATALAARNAGLDRPKHLVLIYPLASTNLDTRSMDESGRSVPLTRSAVRWYLDQYAPRRADWRDPRLDPVGSADLGQVPPTTLVLAEIDPLRSSGEALAQRLQEAGVPTVARLYPGTTHEFFGLGDRVIEAREAQEFVADRLKVAFIEPPDPLPLPQPTPRRPRRVRRR